MSWRDVPIPDRMKHLPLDKRGFPVPVMIQRSADGTPLFTVNDRGQVARQLANNLCGICDGHMEVGEYHFAGGPASAFHPNGSYFDGPLHHECASYAMQVCPYLAMPKFLKRADPAEMAAALPGGALAVDVTMIEGKPNCFVVIKALSFDMVPQPNGIMYLRPRGNPFAPKDSAGLRMLDFDVWKDGVLVENEVAAMELVRVGIAEATGATLRQPTVVQPVARGSRKD